MRADFVPNTFIRIGSDRQILLTMPYVEMGQGTYTAIPMLLAEELEIDLQQVQLEHAPPDPKRYGNPLLAGEQITGGSTAIRAVWKPLREAGAVARTMLIAAAANRWRVDPSDCHAERGEIVHARTGNRIDYADVAADAAHLPVPDVVALKQPSAFRLIGTPAKRLDALAKVNGTAVFGIDARPHGVKFATLAQSPVFGGRVKSVDDAAAIAVKGVRQIVRLDDAVAVVADHMGAANKGMAALVIDWDDGPHARLDTSAIASALRKASLDPGPVAQEFGDCDGAMTTATTKVEASYQVPFLAHAAMEPMNCTVHVRKDSCEIWVGSQVIARAQAAAARTTGLPLDKVVVHNHLIGGGFGRRLEVDGVIRAVQIAQHVDGPVKVVWTREQDIQHDMYRPMFFDRISAGLDDKGLPVAWQHRFAGSSIIARFLPQAFNKGLDPDSTDGAIHLAYSLPNSACRVRAGRAARHSNSLLAQRRAVAQRVRCREFCRRACGRRETGSGCLSARAARQGAARQSRAGSRRGKGGLGRATAAAGRSWRFAAACLWHLYGAGRGGRGRQLRGRCGCVAWSARWIAASSSIPTPSALRSRAPSCSAPRQHCMAKSR